MDPKYLNEMLINCKDNDFVFGSRYLKEGGSDDDDFITYFETNFLRCLEIFFLD